MMPKPTETYEEPLEFRGIVSARGRAEVIIRGDRSAKAIRGLIRLLTMHAELLEGAEAEEPSERAGEEG